MNLSWWAIWTIVAWTLRLVMVPIILRRRFAPVVALAWLSLIFLTPELGILLYLLVGSNRLGGRRVRLHKKVIAALQHDPRWGQQLAHAILPDLEPAQLPVILQAQKVGGMPTVGGNDVEFVSSTRQVIDRLIEDIDAAQHHVHILFYIFACDQTGQRVTEAVCRAAKRGVACRVLADAAGSRPLFRRRSELYRSFCDAGVQCLEMLSVNPLRRRLARLDLRNHRKLAVIDGRVAWTGSQNIIDPDYGRKRGPRWIDLMGRFTGPIVAQLQIVFLEDWAFETGQYLDTPDILPVLRPTGAVAAQAVPTGPSHRSVGLPHVLVAAVSSAQRQVIITSPYLIPDEPMTLALSMAANRGVDVKIVVPQKNPERLVHAASRAYYELMLSAGARVYLHRPGTLHTKTMTVDDSFALLGSSNLDVRSFYLNFELNVLLYGPQVTAALRQTQMRYVAEALPLHRRKWRRRPALSRYVDSAAALFSPLL